MDAIQRQAGFLKAPSEKSEIPSRSGAQQSGPGLKENVRRRGLSSEQRMEIHEAIDKSLEALKPFRQVAKMMLGYYKGSFYGSTEPREMTLTNRIRNAIRVHTRAIVSGQPITTIETDDKTLRASVKLFQNILNDEAAALNLYGLLSQVVENSFFMIGGIKVGLRAGQTFETDDGRRIPVGRPFVRVLPWEGFFFDVCANEPEDLWFIGYETMKPLGQIQKSRVYRQDVVNRLMPSNEAQRSQDTTKDLRTESIKGSYLEQSRRAWVRLREVYHPESRTLYTYAVDQPDLEPLISAEWTKPDQPTAPCHIQASIGPYRELSYQRLHGSFIPVPPGIHYIPMHRVVNDLHAKLLMQAKRQKDFAAVPPGGSRTGEQILNVKDGEVRVMVGSEYVRQISLGGPNQMNLAMFLKALELANIEEGNPHILAGIGATAKTLGQDAMRYNAASMEYADRKEVTRRFTIGLMWDLAWLLATDPLFRRVGYIQAPNAPDVRVPEMLTGPQIRSALSASRIDIDQYSLTPRSPEEQMQILMEILPGWTQLMQQAGYQLNGEALLERGAKSFNIPWLTEIFVAASESPPAQPGGVEPLTGANTPREERIYHGSGEMNPDANFVRKAVGI
ncbi:MAG: hypothetical protein DRP56_05125 [Planctomycetota bacterium]|nr:MAG: hypothetical protein DRP56_05125 [Planctomycetota bacterium]